MTNNRLVLLNRGRDRSNEGLILIQLYDIIHHHHAVGRDATKTASKIIILSS